MEWLFLGLSFIAFAGTIAVTVERFVHFKRIGLNNSAADHNKTELPNCENWTCGSDFTYTVLLTANLGE